MVGRFRLRVLDQPADLLRRESQLHSLEADREQFLGRPRQRPHGGGDHLCQPGVALQARDLGRVGPRRLDTVDQLVHRPLLDALLAEHGEDVRDVVHEDRVGPDDQHAAPLQLAPVGVEQPGRTVEAHRRLAGSRAPLDDEDAVRLAGDQAVLVGLDRGDDVAHVLVAAALEILEQDVRDTVDHVTGRAVERLVVEVEKPAALGAEAAPEHDAVRLRDRRGVERPCGRRLPVDHDRRLLLVHPAAADVQRPDDAVEVEPAEAEAAFGVVEGDEPLRGPGLQHECLDLADAGLAGPLHLPPHLLQAGVGMVDVGLLRLELGVHRETATRVRRCHRVPRAPAPPPRPRRRRAAARSTRRRRGTRRGRRASAGCVRRSRGGGW